jgi:hypothetical protein
LNDGMAKRFSKAYAKNERGIVTNMTTNYSRFSAVIKHKFAEFTRNACIDWLSTELYVAPLP